MRIYASLEEIKAELLGHDLELLIGNDNDRRNGGSGGCGVEA